MWSFFLGFGDNFYQFGTSEDLHRGKGGISGAKLTFFLAVRSAKVTKNWVNMQNII